MPRPPYSADASVPRMRALMCSAATAAWPSAKTPARGVPTAATSPIAYTPGNDVSSVSGFTGIHPSTVMPDSSHDRRRAVDRNGEEQVVGHLAAVAQGRDVARGIQLADLAAWVPFDASLGERA